MTWTPKFRERPPIAVRLMGDEAVRDWLRAKDLRRDKG